MGGFAEFWAGRELWREPPGAGGLPAPLLSYLGVFVVLRRMVFVSAALSEISGVGVATAFYVGAVAGIAPHVHGAIPLLLEPVWFSLLFACVAAATQANNSENQTGSSRSGIAPWTCGAMPATAPT